MTRPSRLTLAGRLATLGGGLGIVAGIIQATIGSRIPEWSGNKHQHVALGLLTIALAASALAAAQTFHAGGDGRDRRVVPVTIWLVIVAGVCSTTVGRLWAIPGLLLMAAAGVAFTACGWHRFRWEVESHWLRGLLALLGGFGLLMTAGTAPTATTAAGVLAGSALVAAAAVARPGRRLVVSCLVATTLPFAIITWWAIIPPLLTLVAFAIGIAATQPAVPLSHTSDPARRTVRPVG